MSVTRHALFAGSAALITRISGLLRQVIFAAIFGAGVESDAFLVAQRVPNVFRDLFAEGSMSNAFVPNFAKTAETEGLKSAWLLANALLGFTLLALGVITLGMTVFAEGWVHIFADGYFDTEGKGELTALLVRVMAPFLAAVSLASIFGGMLNVRGKFFLPALAPAMFNIAIIIGCLLPTSVADSLGIDRIVLIGITATLGGGLMFAILLPSLYKEGFTFRPTLYRHPGLGRLLKFLGPALIGVGTIQIGILIDLQIASGFGDGPVSWLDYAFRIVQLPMNLFAGAIAVAGLAVLSAQVARGENKKARRTLSDSLSLTTFFILPSTVALLIFAHPIITLFYERGAFTPADTLQTSLILQCYALGTVAFCIHRVVVPSFYAFSDPWTPMVLSIGTLVLKVPLALWWTREWLWDDPSQAILGIPLAHAAVASAEVLIMFILLGRVAGGYGRAFYKDIAKICCAGGVMAVVGTFAIQPDQGLLTNLGALLLSAMVFLVASALIGVPQMREAMNRLPLIGNKKRGLPPHIDPDTAAALAAHCGAQTAVVAWANGTATITTDRGTLHLYAKEGVLFARTDATAASHASGPVILLGVLDTSGRPPMLGGLHLEIGTDRTSFKALGDQITNETPLGPALPAA